MMYREKITHCASIIANIYGSKYPYIIKDEHDVWIEVETVHEAMYIAQIENLQRLTFQQVNLLDVVVDLRNHD